MGYASSTDAQGSGASLGEVQTRDPSAEVIEIPAAVVCGGLIRCQGSVQRRWLTTRALSRVEDEPKGERVLVAGCCLSDLELAGAGGAAKHGAEE